MGAAGGQGVKNLSAEEWVQRLEVKSRGHKDGGSNSPPPDATDMSLTEREVVRAFGVNIRLRETEHRKQVDACRTRLAKIFNDTVLEDLHGLPAKLETENNDTKSQEHERLASVRDNALKREVDLKTFKEENCISREARPQEDFSVRLIWILGIVTVETALNATFFAAGSERGLLGGAIQAFVISFINVYAAWICGKYCVPRINHCSANIRHFGWGTFLAVAGVILALNVFAGHYRSALEQDPFVAVIKAVLTFKDSFLGIESAQGWLLTGVGLVASTGLSIKIYISDDPYPGYGEMSRLHQEASEEWMEAQTDFNRRMKANFESVERERRVLTDRLTDLELQCRRQMDIAHQIAEDFTDFCHEQERLCNHVINEYRQANRAIRKKDAPLYFDDNVSLNVEQYAVDVDLEREQERFDALVEGFGRYRDQDSMATKERLNEIHDRTIETLDAFFVS